MEPHYPVSCLLRASCGLGGAVDTLPKTVPYNFALLPLCLSPHSPNRKWVHLGLQTAGMGFMITGLIAIVQSKRNTADQLQIAADYGAAKSIAAGGSPMVMDTQPVMMWSVHSWVSTATLVVYVLQVGVLGPHTDDYFQGCAEQRGSDI